MSFLQFHGIEAGYMIVFLVCSFAYLFSWCVMKLLIPRFKLVQIDK
jgi:ACS family hexuronate transporter-like MFS transporter